MNLKKFVLLLIILLPLNVKANIMCNDGTASPTCQDCHRGCCSHHGGCASRSSGGSYSNNSNANNVTTTPTPTPAPIIVKSSDTSLKVVKVDNIPLEINDNMSINLVDKKEITMEATANDTKATIEYEKTIPLVNGNNNHNIKVIAEDGTVKEYTITINNKILSNNKKFELYYGNKKLKVNSKKKTIEALTVSRKVRKLNFRAVLDDRNAKIKYIGIKNLDYGNNTIKVIITAENKSKATYTMTVKRRLFF